MASQTAKTTMGVISAIAITCAATVPVSLVEALNDGRVTPGSLLLMPGFGGGLDYRPVIKALADIRYTGLVEIFMHPTPRGIPILPTAPEITAAINRSRDYIERCRREVGV